MLNKNKVVLDLFASYLFLLWHSEVCLMSGTKTEAWCSLVTCGGSKSICCGCLGHAHGMKVTHSISAIYLQVKR